LNFWDSSAVVALLVEQPGSKAVGQILAEDTSIWVWWGTRLECLSALCRLGRERALSDDGVVSARSALANLAAAWTEIDPSATIRDSAEALAVKYPLKAADALQLAAAGLSLAGGADDSGFVCLDRQLASGALAEGLRVLPSRSRR
jgi:predicted nucleic acid-binding protein